MTNTQPQYVYNHANELIRKYSHHETEFGNVFKFIKNNKYVNYIDEENNILQFSESLALVVVHAYFDECRPSNFRVNYLVRMLSDMKDEYSLTDDFVNNQNMKYNHYINEMSDNEACFEVLSEAIHEVLNTL